MSGNTEPQLSKTENLSASQKENPSAHLELKRQPKFRVPVFIDLVHNNARSRIMSMMLFAFVAALVTFYFTSSVFASASVSTVRIHYGSSPPTEATFGVPVANFTVVVSNQWSIGIAGVTVRMRAYPANEVGLSATASDGSSITGRSVNCIAHFITDASVTYGEDDFICDPSKAALAVTDAEAVTDGKGIAYFNDFRVNLGSPGAYTIVASHDRAKAAGDTFPSYIESTVSFTSPVVWMESDGSQVPSPLAPNVNFTVGASIVLAKPEREGDVVATTLGQSSRKSTAVPERDYPRLVCALLSFTSLANVDSSGVPDRFAIVGEPFTYLSGNLEQLADGRYATSVNITTSVQSLIGFAQGHRFALWCAGVSVLIGGVPPAALRTVNPKGQDRVVEWPVTLVTDVASVQFVTATNSYSSVEGRLLTRVDVKVVRSNGQPARSALCTMSATPQGVWSSRMGAKKIIGGISGVTDASGVTSFQSVRFTRTGDVGNYTLSISCDGIKASQRFVSVTFSTAGTPLTSDFVVAVATSVRAARGVILHEDPPGWLDVSTRNDVTVGTPWLATPLVEVRDIETFSPVSGKRPIVTASVAGVELDYESLPSDSNGVSVFKRMVVLRTPFTDATNVTFTVSVDGIPATQTFNRTVQPMASSLALECAAIAFTVNGRLAGDEVVRATAGANLGITVRALNGLGTALPLTRVALSLLSSEKRTVLHESGSSASTTTRRIETITDLSGDASFATVALAQVTQNIPATAPLELQFDCPGTEGSTQVLRVITSRRVTPPSIMVPPTMDPSTRTSSVSVTAATAASVSATHPLGMTLSLVWQPREFSDYFPAATLGSAELSTSTGSRSLAVGLPRVPSFGNFVFQAVVDGVESAEYISLTMPTFAGSLAITTGIPAGANASIGDSFAVQPSLAVTSGGIAASGINVYAEILVDEGTRVLRPYSNASDFTIGMIANLATLVLQTEKPLSSAPSTGAGAVTFSRLGFVGLSTAQSYYAVRFCVTPTTCVTDPVRVNPPASEAAIVTLSSVPDIYAIPGKTMSRAIRAIATDSTLNTPEYTIVGRPEIKNGTNIDPLVSDSKQYLASNAGLLDMPGLAFPENTPLGSYRIKVVTPGASSGASTFITVTRSPFTVRVLSTIPSSTAVGNGIAVDVQVEIATGEAIPSILVRAELQSQDTECRGTACGVLRQGSAATWTNSSGIAPMFIVFDAAATGSYKLRFSVEAAGASLLDAVNGFAAGASQISFGVNFASEAVQEQLVASGLSTTASAQTATSAVADARQAPQHVQDQIQKLQQESLVASFATSALYKRIRESSEVSSATDTFDLFNPVGSVVIQEHPAVSISDFTNAVSLSRQPRVQVLDLEGRPMPDERVDIHVEPSAMDLLWDNSVKTDVNGVLQFSDISVTRAGRGDYQMVFSVRGLPSIRSETMTVGASNVSQSSLVQVLAIVVLVLLSPLFFANQPHTHWGYFLGSVVVMAVVPALTVGWVIVNVAESDNIFLQLHISLISTLATLIIIGMLFIFVVWRLGWTRWFFRVYDGENRMLDAYRYAKWLINERRPQLSQEEWEQRIEAEERASPMGRARLYIASKWPEQANTLDKLFGNNDGIDIYNIKVFQPPPLKVPEDLTPVRFPMKFLIVFSITGVLLIIAIFLALHITWNTSGELQRAAAILPEPPSVTPDEKNQINHEIQSGLVMAFSLVADTSPQFAFMRNFEANIRQLDVFGTWERVFIIIDDLRSVVENAGYTGITLACIAVVATMVTLSFATSKIMWRIRRGELRHMKQDCTLIYSDRYVGLHVMHFVIVFLSVFFIGALIYIIFAARRLILLIVETFLVTILTSLISVLITVFFELFIVGRWWVYGLTIRLIYPYFMWTVFGVILSLVNGIIQTIVRWIKAIFSITVLFARMDYDMFPSVLLILDNGYWAFYSMLFADEEYNNPIFLAAVSVFMSELIMKREFDAGVQTGLEKFGEGTITLPHIKNITRIHMRDRTGNPLCLRHQPHTEDYPWDLYLGDVVNRRHRRAAARWRLCMLLVLNPSLLQYRKHRDVPRGFFEEERKMHPAEVRERRRQSTIMVPAGSNQMGIIARQSIMASTSENPVISSSSVNQAGANAADLSTPKKDDNGSGSVGHFLPVRLGKLVSGDTGSQPTANSGPKKARCVVFDLQGLKKEALEEKYREEASAGNEEGAASPNSVFVSNWSPFGPTSGNGGDSSMKRGDEDITVRSVSSVSEA